MTRERHEQLIQGYLDRVLTPSEVEELDRLLVSDAEFRAAFVEASRHESFLQGSLKELATPGTGEQTPRATPRPFPRPRLDRRFPSPRPTLWMPVLVAAGILFAIVLVVSTAGPGPASPKPNRSETARAPAPVKADPVEDPVTPARAEAERKLAEAERRRKELEAAPPAPQTDASGEEKRREDLERARKIEEEMRRQLELTRPKPPAVTPEAPAKPAAPPPPKQEVEKTEPTQVAVAKAECVEGGVSLLTSSGKRAFKGIEDLLPGQGLETAAVQGRAAVRFPDGTRLEIGPATEIQEIRVDGGKRVVVIRGTVTAAVAKQPKDEAMLFPTPHGEAKVLGTTLRLSVDPDAKKGTRLEVLEGSVQLTRKSDGKAVEVASGHFAVAATGVTLESRPSPIDEIVLLPRHAKTVKGAEWKIINDPRALTTAALHASRQWTADLATAAMKQGSLGYVDFEFNADANREYSVWVRAACGEVRNIEHDAVGVAFPDGLFVKPCGFYTKHGLDAHLFTAYFQQQGYWFGSDVETPRGGTTPNPYVPVRVQFSRPGKQTLRLYPCEGPIRVDAIWLSTTAKQRPAADHPIPAAAGLKFRGK